MGPFGTLAMIGLLVSVICGFWLIGIAFRASIWWGLAVFFIPFAGIAFVVTHWDDAGKVWLAGVAGAGLMIGMALAFPNDMPGFAKARQVADSTAVKRNMREVMVAAEGYAVDHEGRYPTNLEVFKSYFPGGGGAKEGTPPTNPFTDKPEWPVLGTIKDVAAARAETPGVMKKGEIEYSPIFDSEHHAMSYAIRGGDESGHAVAGSGGEGTMVLSNE